MEWTGPETSILCYCLAEYGTVMSLFWSQGMSHYLEHMLFMGSEKFPDENEYDSYLASKGGGANAFTEMVRT